MMTDDNPSKVARWKYGMIFFLASTLASMIAQPFFVAQDPVAPKEESPRRRARRTSQAPRKESQVEERAPRRIIEFQLDEVLAHDPFASMAPELVARKSNIMTSAAKGNLELAEEEAKEVDERALRQTLDRIKQTGITMIVETPAGNVAKIGDKTVREGDKLDGFRVAKISTEGVVLSRERRN